MFMVEIGWVWPICSILWPLSCCEVDVGRRRVTPILPWRGGDIHDGPCFAPRVGCSGSALTLGLGRSGFPRNLSILSITFGRAAVALRFRLRRTSTERTQRSAAPSRRRQRRRRTACLRMQADEEACR